MKTKVKRIVVNVTERDIKRAPKVRQGYASILSSCPVALALRRATRNPDVAVSGGSRNDAIVVGTFRGYAGKRVQKFILDFDNKRPVKPFKFNLVLRPAE